ncbi:MAG: hypothetical protein IJ744_06975 [Lachnospiraceae bacterium]|nr:hypothetical protein [Lachnospiraceae bacterium]
MDKNEFNREWSLQFPNDRYVITIYQRYSVFEKGKRVWLNTMFDDALPPHNRYENRRFVVVLDKAREYTYTMYNINRTMSTFFIRNEEHPMWAELFSLEEAETIAKAYSEKEYKAAVMEWFDDFDMF